MRRQCTPTQTAVASPGAGMRALALLALTAALTMQANAGVSTPAYSFAGTVNTGGSSQSGTASVSISAAGTLSSIQVLTQGVPGKDFTLSTGGTCATGTTYSVSQTCTVSVNFQPTYPGVRQGAVVLVGSGNTVLGTQLLLATGVGATGVFVPGTMTTLAGDNLFIYGGDGVQATSASLYLPMGGAADAAGNIYIADSQNQRIRMVNADRDYFDGSGERKFRLPGRRRRSDQRTTERTFRCEAGRCWQSLHRRQHQPRGSHGECTDARDYDSRRNGRTAGLHGRWRTGDGRHTRPSKCSRIRWRPFPLHLGHQQQRHSQAGPHDRNYYDGSWHGNVWI